MAAGNLSKGPSAVRSHQKRSRVDILPVQSRASEVYERFITRLKKISRRWKRTAKRMENERDSDIMTEHLKGILVEK